MNSRVNGFLTLAAAELGRRFRGACAIAICAGAAVALAACQKMSSDPVERGQADFNALGCVKCHAMGNEGGTYGPNLGFIGFRKSPEWLDQWLANPHAWRAQTVMPNFHLSGTPDREQIRHDLVAYLSAQKGQAFDTTGGRPWDASDVASGDQIKRGELLFNKAGCVACHSQNGRGGYPNNNVVGGQIPALTNVSQGYTKAELINKIRNGVPQPASADPSKPAPMVYMPSWGKVLKDDEIEAVASYLISLGGNAKGGGSELGF